jgi:hypothetical protein
MERREFDATKIERFPIPPEEARGLGRNLHQFAQALTASLCRSLVARQVPSAAALATARSESTRLRAHMIALQEELDWECYRCYGLIDEDLRQHEGLVPGIHFGERAFEIVMARQMAKGELETAWFERHGSTPMTEIPAHWPEEYRKLVARRVEIIETNLDIAPTAVRISRDSAGESRDFLGNWRGWGRVRDQVACSCCPD